MKTLRLYITMLVMLLMCTQGLQSQVLLVNQSDIKQQDTIIEQQKIILPDSTFSISPDIIRAIKGVFRQLPDPVTYRNWQIQLLTSDVLRQNADNLVDLRPFPLRFDFFEELKLVLGKDIDKYLLPEQLTSRLKAAPLTYNQATSRYSVIWVSPFDTMILIVPEWYASDYENFSLWDFK